MGYSIDEKNNGYMLQIGDTLIELLPGSVFYVMNDTGKTIDSRRI